MDAVTLEILDRESLRLDGIAGEHTRWLLEHLGLYFLYPFLYQLDLELLLSLPLLVYEIRLEASTILLSF